MPAARSAMPDAAVLVIAKAPLPGRAKTRLTPPLHPVAAARLAEAALLDTLAVVARTPCRRRVLVFDGEHAERWCPRGAGFEVIAQRGAGLAERLAAAFADAGEPALLVGMDTPQLTPALLEDGLRALARPGVGAVLGPSSDGGYWSIGLQRADAAVFAGVPMSAAGTCAAQRERLRALGLTVHEQPVVVDVDTFDTALAVAALAPGTRFAAAVSAVSAVAAAVSAVSAVAAAGGERRAA